MKAWLVAMLVIVPLLACGGGSKAQGGVGQSCYPNGTCNAGLSCFSKLCVDVNVDGAGGAGGAAGEHDAGGGGTTAGGGSDAAAGAGMDATAGAGSDAAAGAGTDAAAGADGAVDASVTDASSDAAPFNIAALPGLVVWLDAAKGSAGTSGMVVTWSDQSAVGNNAGSFGSSTPALVANAIGTLPAIEFSPTAELGIQPTSAAASLGFGTGELLVEVVAKWTPSASDAYLFVTGQQTALFALIGDDSGHAIAAFGTGTQVVRTTNATLGNGAFHLIGARRTGSAAAPTIEARVNGAVDGTATGASDAFDLMSTETGEIGPGTNLEIAEVVVVKGATSDGDLARLEAYLKTKYGL